eukprot:2113863-Prymnesium_polylepis.1
MSPFSSPKLCALLSAAGGFAAGVCAVGVAVSACTVGPISRPVGGVPELLDAALAGTIVASSVLPSSLSRATPQAANAEDLPGATLRVADTGTLMRFA